MKARPAPVTDLIQTVRSATCGSECQSAACRLADIARGAYVHTHNLKSDYIPTWDREGKEMR